MRYWLVTRVARKATTITIKCKGDGSAYRFCPAAYAFLVDWQPDNIKCTDGISLMYKGARLRLKEPCVVEFDYAGVSVKLLDSFPFLDDILFENFFGGAYDDLDVRGRVVLDVGAGVGDTSILFLLRGASEVVALEPFPSLYKKALVNLKANGLDNGVILLNAALSAEDGVAYAPVESPKSYISFRPVADGIEIKTYSLKTLVKEYGLEDAVLKMDCEGCEYEALGATDEKTLRAFRQILVEYHNGPQPILAKLERAGFATTLKPIRSADIPLEKQGYILATRAS